MSSGSQFLSSLQWRLWRWVSTITIDNIKFFDWKRQLKCHKQTSNTVHRRYSSRRFQIRSAVAGPRTAKPQVKFGEKCPEIFWLSWRQWWQSPSANLRRWRTKRRSSSTQWTRTQATRGGYVFHYHIHRVYTINSITMLVIRVIILYIEYIILSVNCKLRMKSQLLYIYDVTLWYITWECEKTF